MRPLFSSFNSVPPPIITTLVWFLVVASARSRGQSLRGSRTLLGLLVAHRTDVSSHQRTGRRSAASSHRSHGGVRSSTPPLLYTASVCCAWVIQGLTVLCSSFCSSLLLYTASRHTHRLLTGDSSTLHDEEDPRTLEVRDARQAASPLTLRRSGFELRHWPSAVVDFYNEDLIRSQYHPETVEPVARRTCLSFSTCAATRAR